MACLHRMLCCRRSIVSCWVYWPGRKTIVKNFELYASDNQVSGFQQAYVGESVVVAAAMRQRVLDKANEGDFGVNAADWQQRQTQNINLMKTMEDRISEELLDLASQISNAAWQGFSFALGISLAILVLVASVAYWIIRNILTALNQAMGVVERPSQGDLTVRIEVEQQDEFGRMLAALGS